MYSKAGWYARAGAIWAAAIAAGCGISYLLFLLPVHRYLLGLIDAALWVGIGSALAGPWSYATYVQETENDYGRR
jgi:hypothetical protein